MLIVGWTDDDVHTLCSLAEFPESRCRQAQQDLCGAFPDNHAGSMVLPVVTKSPVRIPCCQLSKSAGLRDKINDARNLVT